MEELNKQSNKYAWFEEQLREDLDKLSNQDLDGFVSWKTLNLFWSRKYRFSKERTYKIIRILEIPFNKFGVRCKK